MRGCADCVSKGARGREPRSILLATHPDGQAFAFGYDGLDRLHDVSHAGTQLDVFAYDDAGRRRSHFAGALAYGYDGAGRLTSLTVTDASNTGRGTVMGLGHSPAGQITSQTRSNELYAFTGKTDQTTSYVANGLNQYTAVGGGALAYDANGNLISSGSATYVYNAENRLVSAGGTALAYDPLGRLWQVSGPQGTTRFLHDGDQLTAEYDGAGALTRRYVHGTGDDDPLIAYEGSGVGASERRFLFTDHQGSVIGVLNGASTSMGVNAYDEYGMPAVGNQGRFQYTGQAWLPELGLYHYKARAYSPALGRFLQTDPIGYDDQINLYAYVANDPVNGRDPTGQQTVVPRDDGRRVVVVYPEQTHTHVTERHGPNGTASDRYASEMTKSQAERLAMRTMVDTERQGTFGPSDRGSTAYESNQSGWFSSLGENGQDINRVVTRPLERLTDPRMQADVAKEKARPEIVAGIAAAEATNGGRSTGPIEVQVIVTQYPKEERDLNLMPR